MKSLGERIRELREAKDLSLRELSKKAGDISPAFMSDVELGRRHPSDQVLAAIARVIGASFDELKKLDNRPALEEMKHRVMRDPMWGFAFRRVLDENITPDDLLELAKKKAGRDKK